MQIARWGNSLAVRIPSELARKLGLKEGDSLDFVEDGEGSVRLVSRQYWLDQIEQLRRPLPDGWKDWKVERDTNSLRGTRPEDGFHTDSSQ